jgi:uncharacterized protein with PQ loop repeat
MNLFHLFYLIGTAAAVMAGVPQLRKLLITKRADEFSISTWIIWLSSQVTALAYGWSTGDLLYAGVSLLWLTFYAAMVILIFKYRSRSPVTDMTNLRRLARYFSN